MNKIITYMIGFLPHALLAGAVMLIFFDQTRFDFLHRFGHRRAAIVRGMQYTALGTVLLVAIGVVGVGWWIKNNQLEAARIFLNFLTEYMEISKSL